MARFNVFFHLIQPRCCCKHAGSLTFIPAWIQLLAEDICRHNMIHGELILMLLKNNLKVKVSVEASLLIRFDRNWTLVNILLMSRYVLFDSLYVNK